MFAHLGTKVLVSSGSITVSTDLDSTEVVDLKSGKIFSMAPLGTRTEGATGGLLDGLPVICGGANDKQIHSIDKDQSKFRLIVHVQAENASGKCKNAPTFKLIKT